MALLAAQAVRPTSAQKSGENAKRGTYALSEYSAVLLGVFGLSWGIACSEIAGAVWGSSQPAALPWMVALAFVLALAILQLEGHLEGDGALRSTFGLRVRCIVALAGAVWVSSPFLSASAPAALFVAIVAVYMIQFILMLMFSAEISIEKGLPLGQVASKNCMLFYGCTLLGIVIHGLLSVLFSEVQLLYDALAMATVIPSLALIPLLPSRTSSAATFTLTALPEDENLDLRIETGRRVLAEFHGLTEREAQIADLLVEGCTRGEIAERLQLSPWTVKTHAASVYKKVGVHSNKELLRRLEELGSGKR